MIVGSEAGDILSPANHRDIIIGMNTSLGEVNGIGRPFVRNIIPSVARDTAFDGGVNETPPTGMSGLLFYCAAAAVSLIPISARRSVSA